MPLALPLVTRREIVSDFRLDQAATIGSGIRALKNKHALSPGVSVAARTSSGQLGGRVHLYSALNRDAARAVRHKHFARATMFAEEAAKLDASPQAQRIARALGSQVYAGAAETAAGLARALAAPELSADVIALQRRLTDIRTRLALAPAGGGWPTQLGGHVVSMDDARALVKLNGVEAPMTVPRETLLAVGLAIVGVALVANWEMLSGGRTVLSVEPAIEMPEVNDLGEPLADLYGTPWGQVLVGVDAAALTTVPQPTIQIPDGIPDVA